MIAEKFHENTGIKIEIIDISKQLKQRIKLMLKGSIRTPQFMINGEKLPQITSMNQLTEYMR